MPLRLDAAAPGFDAAFRAFLNARRDPDADVSAAVRDIIARVRSEGDAAVRDLTLRFDRINLAKTGMAFTPAEIDGAAAKVEPATLRALEHAAERIATFHARHKPANDSFTDADGVQLGARWSPISAAGLYVPGGKAAYPSSVLMNAIPAKVAGVPRIAMVVPVPDGVVNPLILAAAKLAGVTEIYRIGGAQAVAALAFGTATIAPVDKITGPGNAYVAEAKRQVFGTVGIDMIAGPSEILVVADAQNDPAWIAADLLSQAEHDEAAQAILITDDAAFGDAVARAVDTHLATLGRTTIAAQSWKDWGAIITVKALADAAPLVDALAPEHLELAVADPDALSARISNAGAIFMGRHTPEAIGDYVAGPNHVLPTARSARFSSGLSVLDFMKRTTLVRCSPEGLSAIGPSAIALADAEGLGAHALSVAIRLNRRS